MSWRDPEAKNGHVMNRLLDFVSDTARADALGLTAFDLHCVDCGVNTAPSIWHGRDVTPALPGSWEFYWLKPEVWTLADMEELDGSLCVGCIEARLGRRLRRKDFDFTRYENRTPVAWLTPRLRARRGDE